MEHRGFKVIQGQDYKWRIESYLDSLTELGIEDLRFDNSYQATELIDSHLQEPWDQNYNYDPEC